MKIYDKIKQILGLTIIVPLCFILLDIQVLRDVIQEIIYDR